MSLNKVMLIGRLGNDPEGKTLTSGNFVCNLSLATNKSWKDKEGNKKERTEWHKVVCFGKVGELAAQYLNKGSKAYVEGELQTRSWETDGGEKRYSTEINASQIQFLDDKKKSDGNGNAQSGFDSEGPSFTDEDIPF